MKRNRNLLIITAVLLIAAMVLSACSKKPETLEDYASKNREISDKIDETATTSGVNVEIKGNDIIYTYDLADIEGYTEEIVKNDAAVDSLEEALDNSGESFRKICVDIGEATGIGDIRVIVRYTYKGEEIVSRTFTADDKTPGSKDKDKDKGDEEDAEDSGSGGSSGEDDDAA